MGSKPVEPSIYDNQAFLFFGPSIKRKGCLLQKPLVSEVLEQQLSLSSIVTVQVFLVHMNDIHDLLSQEGTRVLLKKSGSAFEVQATKRSVHKSTDMASIMRTA